MVYNRAYYLEHKEMKNEYQKRDRLKHKEKRRKAREIYESKPEVKQRIKLKNKQWKLNNIEKVKLQKKKDDARYNQKHREQIRKRRVIYEKEYRIKNKSKLQEYVKFHQKLPHVKARRNLLERIRRKNNPRSNRSFSYDLQDAMNNVRIRDKNTCQWYGCKLTFKEAPIHVHHIFPRNEYPLLELVEQYMICYCANHHGLFHRMRGDHYSEMISPKYQENKLVTSTRGGGE